MPWNYIIAFPPFRQGQIKLTELILQKLFTFVTGHSQRSTAMVSRASKGNKDSRFPRTISTWQCGRYFQGVIHNHYHE